MKAPKEVLPLSEAVTHLLEECRMVLPGIQALFGFQLIVVFNSTFRESLSSTEQCFHLAAIGLVAMAVALVMTPVALHRQTTPQAATQDFLTVASRLLLLSMFPLMLGISLDFYLIARLILNNTLISLLLSTLLLILFSTLWFLFPRLTFLQKLVRGGR
ncbi:MAG TPA: DUF6328 family protein [Pyrinomonadaceae bacterium]|jgi:hypothetical protein